jgi:hypothetical protein
MSPNIKRPLGKKALDWISIPDEMGETLAKNRPTPLCPNIKYSKALINVGGFLI